MNANKQVDTTKVMMLSKQCQEHREGSEHLCRGEAA